MNMCRIRTVCLMPKHFCLMYITGMIIHVFAIVRCSKEAGGKVSLSTCGWGDHDCGGHQGRPDTELREVLCTFGPRAMCLSHITH